VENRDEDQSCYQRGNSSAFSYRDLTISLASIEELIQWADKALYRAKKEGKSDVCFNNNHLRKY